MKRLPALLEYATWSHWEFKRCEILLHRAAHSGADLGGACSTYLAMEVWMRKELNMSQSTETETRDMGECTETSVPPAFQRDSDLRPYLRNQLSSTNTNPVWNCTIRRYKVQRRAFHSSLVFMLELAQDMPAQVEWAMRWAGCALVCPPWVKNKWNGQVWLTHISSCFEQLHLFSLRKNPPKTTQRRRSPSGLPLRPSLWRFIMSHQSSLRTRFFQVTMCYLLEKLLCGTSETILTQQAQGDILSNCEQAEP